MAKQKSSRAHPAGKAVSTKLAVQEALAALKRLASKKVLEDMPRRYGIYTKKAFGVKVGDMQRLAKGIGDSHELALALWETGWYEARMLACMVDDAERVTPAQMDRWCRDFDNWGICDTVCFKLFDRSPHAMGKVRQWAGRDEEFIKRGAFALLACVALHSKQANDSELARCLPLIEKAATDERNFVKKGVSWALRAIGQRSPALHAPAVKLAQRLAASPEQAPRWIGKDALRDLTRPAVMRRMAARSRAKG